MNHPRPAREPQVDSPSVEFDDHPLAEDLGDLPVIHVDLYIYDDEDGTEGEPSYLMAVGEVRGAPLQRPLARRAFSAETARGAAEKIRAALADIGDAAHAVVVPHYIHSTRTEVESDETTED